LLALKNHLGEERKKERKKRKKKNNPFGIWHIKISMAQKQI
jgi:hypothetical protein